MTDPRNFAVCGVAGYVAQRHLRAIADTGHKLIAAVDPHDAVGTLDRFSFDVRFFTEIERFDRHLEKLRREGDAQRVHYLSICSPNYLHDAHIRLALRVGADAICEKPLVINPWNLDALEEMEHETRRRIFTILQLRLHPELKRLKEKMDAKTGMHEVCLTYVTARGPWYDVSWKGSEERSGGLVTNIGIHLFDLLLWMFGPIRRQEVHLRERRRGSGILELERARVRWFLSAEADDLPFRVTPGSRTAHRAMSVDGENIEFTDGMGDLHTRSYEEIFAGRGFGTAEARPAIELVHRIRSAPLHPAGQTSHPLLVRQ
jgi:UDP-N-acetyl-2-amino-2-deoxyglucuronate dehydrogenase